MSDFKVADADPRRMTAGEWSQGTHDDHRRMADLAGERATFSMLVQQLQDCHADALYHLHTENAKLKVQLNSLSRANLVAAKLDVNGNGAEQNGHPTNSGPTVDHIAENVLLNDSGHGGRNSECSDDLWEERSNGSEAEAKDGETPAGFEDAICQLPSRQAVKLKQSIDLTEMEVIAQMVEDGDSRSRIRDSVINNNGISTSSFSSFMLTLARNKWFETIFCCLIFLNAIAMAIECEFRGRHLAVTLGEEFDSGRTSIWTNIETDIKTLSFVFGVLFTVEICIKVVGLRMKFFMDGWNYIDALVVAVWLINPLFENAIAINSQVFRLARMVRLLRLIRLVRSIKGFDALYIMTTAMKGSVDALLWTFVFLLIVSMGLALFVNQILQALYFAEDASILSAEQRDVQMQVYIYFGTFLRALFSMFELTLANWPPAIRLLAENVSEWFFLFGVLHKLIIGFAVIGVINGVFMQETFRVASIDDTIMVRQKARAQAAHLAKMKKLFGEAKDLRDIDGLISKEEWITVCADDQVKLWLASMDLSPDDAETLFGLIDASGDGFITLKELVGGVGHLKGPARSVDLLRFMSVTQDNHESVVQGQRQLRNTVFMGSSTRSDFAWECTVESFGSKSNIVI